MIHWTAGIPDDDWDDLLFKKDGAFTQSSHWAAVQSALGRKTFYAQGNGWQCLAILEKGQLGDRIYCPYGPQVSSTSSFSTALNALKQLAKEQKAAYIRMEPFGKISPKQLRSRGLKPAPKDSQPKHTWVKDLTKPVPELLSEVSSSNRNRFNTATKKGLLIKQSTAIGDLPIFLDMIHEVARSTGIKTYSDQAYTTIASTLMQRGAAKIYIATHDGKPVASALIYDSPTTRYYAHAGSYHEARKLHPASPMMIQMILDAKENGQKNFDFFGIAPPDQPNHKWAGFTQFKQSFGGYTREFNGTWELPVKTLHYTAYRLLHKAKKIFR